VYLEWDNSSKEDREGYMRREWHTYSQTFGEPPKKPDGEGWIAVFAPSHPVDKPACEEVACKRCNAYRTLVTSLEEQLAHHRSQAGKYQEAIQTLESERAANATLTEELAAQPQAVKEAEGELWVCAQESGREGFIRSGPLSELEKERDRMNALGGDYFIRNAYHHPTASKEGSLPTGSQQKEVDDKWKSHAFAIAERIVKDGNYNWTPEEWFDAMDAALDPLIRADAAQGHAPKREDIRNQALEEMAIEMEKRCNFAAFGGNHEKREAFESAANIARSLKSQGSEG
jgi:hypothetical protein